MPSTNNKKRRWQRLGLMVLAGLSLFGVFSSRLSAKVQDAKQKLATSEYEKDVTRTKENAHLQKSLTDVLKEVATLNFLFSRTQYAFTFMQILAIVSWWLVLSFLSISMIFNYPIPLGKIFLSALPGAPHTGIMRLVSDEDTFIIGKTYDIYLSVDSGGKKVSNISAAITYPKDFIEILDVEKKIPELSKVDSNTFSNKTGEITIAYSEEKGEVFERKADLAKISMTPRANIGKGEMKIRFANIPGVHSSSMLLSDAPHSSILGKIQNLSFRVLGKNLEAEPYHITSLDREVIVDGDPEEWQEVIGYDISSFQRPKNILDSANLLTGKIDDDQDINLVYQFSETSGLLAFFIAGSDAIITKDDRLSLSFADFSFVFDVESSGRKDESLVKECVLLSDGENFTMEGVTEIRISDVVGKKFEISYDDYDVEDVSAVKLSRVFSKE